jgi:hypothetical protein
MKPTTLVFYENNPTPALAHAKDLRTGLNLVGVRMARRHLGEDRETCEHVIAMPDVSKEGLAELNRLYSDKVETLSTTPAPRVIEQAEPVEVIEPVEDPRPRRKRIHRAETL